MKGVFERDRTVTFGFTNRHANHYTTNTMHSRTRNRTWTSPLGPERDLHFTIRERKERELNPQGTLKMLDRLPTGARHQSGCPSVFLHTSTRNRTQNTPLEAEHDFHFTIEAKTQRKARDSNPHGPKTARFSKPARQTLFGYLPLLSRGPSGN